MKKEELTALGVAEDAAEKIIKAFDKETKTLKGDLKAANEKLEKYSDIDIDAEKASEYERGKSEVQADFDKYKNDRAIDDVLLKSGARNSTAVKALLDMDKVSFKDGKPEGLAEQLEALKKDSGYLFETDSKKPSFADKTGGDLKITKEAFAKMSYKERLDLFNTNKELYMQLAE